MTASDTHDNSPPESVIPFGCETWGDVVLKLIELLDGMDARLTALADTRDRLIAAEAGTAPGASHTDEAKV